MGWREGKEVQRDRRKGQATGLRRCPCGHLAVVVRTTYGATKVLLS